MTGLEAVLTVLAAALGASLASFLVLLEERRARGESVLGRSRCGCGRVLRASENVPIFGYLARRGRAPCCGSRIPLRYLALELIGALLLAAAVWFPVARGLAVTVIIVTVVHSLVRRPAPRASPHQHRLPEDDT